MSNINSNTNTNSITISYSNGYIMIILNLTKLSNYNIKFNSIIIVKLVLVLVGYKIRTQGKLID